MTDRGKALLVSAVVAWLASRILGVPELSMLALGMVVLLLLAVVFTYLASAQLTVTRGVHPPRLFFDATGTVEVRLENLGRVPTALLQVEDEVPGTLADSARFVLRPVGAGETVTARYTLHGRHRGRFTVGPLTVRLRDPFGLVNRSQRFTRTDEVVVYPPVWRLPPGVPLGGQTATGGEGRPRPLASGEDLANVREYVRGDDLRKVHWRTTAHRGKLMVRQDEAPQNPQGVVALDLRAAAHQGHGPTASIESAVAAAASATYHLAERSYAVTVLTGPLTSPPRPLPWRLALDQLADVAVDARADLTGLLRQLGQGVAGEGVLCAVVTVPAPAELRQLVRAGRAFATRLALLVDAGSHAARYRPRDGTDQVAMALRAAGWRVTVLRNGDRLDERWRELVLNPRPALAGSQ